MYVYAGSAAAASAVTPFAQPTNTTNDSGIPAQGAAVAKAAGAPDDPAAYASALDRTRAAIAADDPGLGQVAGRIDARQAFLVTQDASAAFAGVMAVVSGTSVARGTLMSHSMWASCTESMALTSAALSRLMP